MTSDVDPLPAKRARLTQTDTQRPGVEEEQAEKVWSTLPTTVLSRRTNKDILCSRFYSSQGPSHPSIRTPLSSRTLSTLSIRIHTPNPPSASFPSGSSPSGPTGRNAAGRIAVCTVRAAISYRDNSQDRSRRWIPPRTPTGLRCRRRRLLQVRGAVDPVQLVGSLIQMHLVHLLHLLVFEIECTARIIWH